eukprot:TRINITY_DN28688_c0_g1_i1.p1 TRINITY_DN28688_c0_g1~~TRINITY_DN28688_c0_g1_i1.p1  ORF type:complete len:129 (+),score=9.82 TRINITY_DN28688_c0_g1_i1:22-408(+)
MQQETRSNDVQQEQALSDEALYKIMREGEVQAYHHIIRALVMRNGPSMVGISESMLQDVRSLLNIPEERHACELRAALLSPDVLAAVSVPPSRKRVLEQTCDWSFTSACDSDSTEDDSNPPIKRVRGR